jgi:sulfur carrier protein
MIDVIVNGRTLVTAAKTVSDLVAAQDFTGAKIATAVNGHFVPEGRRATTLLNPGDQVEIVAPRQGG